MNVEDLKARATKAGIKSFSIVALTILSGEGEQEEKEILLMASVKKGVRARVVINKESSYLGQSLREIATTAWKLGSFVRVVELFTTDSAPAPQEVVSV